MRKATNGNYASHQFIQNTHRTTTPVSLNEYQTKNRYPPACAQNSKIKVVYDTPDAANIDQKEFGRYQPTSSSEAKESLESGPFSSNTEHVYENDVETKNAAKKSNCKNIPWLTYANTFLLITSLIIGVAALVLFLQERFQPTSLKQANNQLQLETQIHFYEKLLKTQSEQIAINSKKIQDNYHSILTSLTYQSRDCKDVLENNFTTSGVYFIFINHEPVQVYCDMETDGGGWTIFQKRFDGSEQFNRSFAEYEEGFGDGDGEYWLGLQHIYTLTNSRSYTLRVDLEDFYNNTAYAEYSTYVLGDSGSSYKLNISGYSGNASDSLQRQNNMPFQTNVNYFRSVQSGWWGHRHHSLFHFDNSNLNAKYYKEGECDRYDGIVWGYWNGHNCLKRTEMKLRQN